MSLTANTLSVKNSIRLLGIIIHQVDAKWFFLKFSTSRMYLESHIIVKIIVYLLKNFTLSTKVYFMAC